MDEDGSNPMSNEDQEVLIEIKAEMASLKREKEELQRLLEPAYSENSIENLEIRMEVILKNTQERIALLEKQNEGILVKDSQLLRATVMKIIERITFVENGGQKSEETILVMGGLQPDQVNESMEMAILNKKRNKWKTLSLKLPHNNSFFGSVLLDGEIYILGGTGLEDRVFRLDRLTMRWVELARMSEKRIKSSFLAFEGCIWAFGGLENAKVVEKYSPDTNKWTLIPPMRLSYSSAAVVHNGKIYITGSDKGGMTRSMETFDVTTGIWSHFMDLPESFAYLQSMISNGDSLFILAEHKIWEMNPGDKEVPWIELAPMNNQRRFFSTLSLNKQIYAIGGAMSKRVAVFDGTSWLGGPELSGNWYGNSSLLIPSHIAKSLAGYETLQKKRKVARSYHQLEASTRTIEGSSDGRIFLEVTRRAAERWELLQNKSITDGNTIFIMGGESDGKQLDEMLVLDWKRAEWQTLSLKLPACNSSFGSVCLDNKVYIFGGSNKKMYKLDFENPNWMEMAEMSELRAGISNSSLVIEDCIWVFGGNTNGKALNTVEKYYPEANQWIQMIPMKQARDAAIAAVCLGKIIVCGGYDGTNYLKSVASFDPSSGVWTQLADMPGPRAAASAVYDTECIVIMGGKNGSECYADTWIVTIDSTVEDAVWKEIAPMAEKRYAFGAALTGGELFTVGGTIEEGEYKSTEVLHNGIWRRGLDLPYGIKGMSTVVISSAMDLNLFSNQWLVGLPKQTTRGETEETTEETVMILGGGIHKNMSDDMIIYDKTNSDWKTAPLKMPFANSYGGGIYLNGEVYIFGGLGLYRKLFKLDAEQLEWIEMAEMHEKRRLITASSLAFQGCIWTFGGLDGPVFLDTVEKYCPETNRWIKMPPMREARGAAAAAAFNGKIIVSGGTNDTQLKVWLKSVESFDPVSGIWTPLVDMPAALCCHSMVSDGSGLVILGGLASVWKTNPDEENASWMELQPLKEARSEFSAAFIENEIFAIGGLNDLSVDKNSNSNNYLRTVEIFNGESWRSGPELASNRYGASAIVIPSNLVKRILAVT